ncbi:MAG: carbohydrate kinase [bacterium]|nr:carbohydrate kinase [bacterium]
MLDKNKQRPRIFALGELLWDVFPDGARLGGAGTNFAVMSVFLGAEAVLVSRIGDDENGRRAVEMLSGWGLDTRFIQVDDSRATGTVRVTVEDGEPSYEIVEGVAWDVIAWEPDLGTQVQEADVLYFGSLIQREETSRETIQRLIAGVPDRCLKVLDLNFRQHYHSQEVVRTSVGLSDILKLNVDEVPILRQYLGGVDDPTSFCRDIRERFQIRQIVLTMGAGGCRVLGPEGDVQVPAAPQKVVNTVGAGDAFTAAFVLHHLQGADARTCAERANEVGGYVTTQDGGTPRLPASFSVF